MTRSQPKWVLDLAHSFEKLVTGKHSSLFLTVTMIKGKKFYHSDAWLKFGPNFRLQIKTISLQIKIKKRFVKFTNDQLPHLVSV